MPRKRPRQNLHQQRHPALRRRGAPIDDPILRLNVEESLQHDDEDDDEYLSRMIEREIREDIERDLRADW